MRPVTLITGASAGIGMALAHEFARHGHELLLIARREQRLAELADAIAAQGHKRPLLLPVDLAQPDARPHHPEQAAGAGAGGAPLPWLPSGAPGGSAGCACKTAGAPSDAVSAAPNDASTMKRVNLRTQLSYGSFTSAADRG